MIIAIYPGSFDPVTNGHLDIIIRASRLFEKLVIGVYDRPMKNLLFTTTERLQLVEKSIADLGESLDKKVRHIENSRFRQLHYESPNQTVLEVDAAKLLNLPFMNIHTLFDEQGRRILQAKIDAALKPVVDATIAALNEKGLDGEKIVKLALELQAKYNKKTYAPWK